MTTTTLNRRVKSGITDFSLKTKAGLNPYVLVLSQPSSFTLQPGIEEMVSETRTQLGERAIEATDIDAFQPVLSVTFPGWTPELVAMRFGRELEVGSQEILFTKKFRVTATNQTRAAAAAGEEGNGIVLDEPRAAASYLKALGQSTALTRVDTATFDPAVNTESFSIGADGAWSFSDDLLGADVSISVPYTVTDTLYLGEGAFSEFEGNALYITRDLQIFQIYFPSLTINLGDGDINPGGGEAPLTFRVTYDGSTCTPIQFRWIGQARAC